MKCRKRSIVESEMKRRVLDTRQKLRAPMSLVKYDSDFRIGQIERDLKQVNTNHCFKARIRPYLLNRLAGFDGVVGQA